MADHSYPGRRLSYSGARCTVRYVGEVQGTKGHWVGVEWDDPARGKHNGSHDGVKYFDCQNPSPTAGSFVRPNRKSDKSYGFLDALRKKYAPSDLDELTDKGAIKISGKTVEEVGFEKISQQLANLHELRIVVLDGLCIHGILPQRNDAYIDNGKQESREIEESRTGEPQNQEWKLALRELEELNLKIEELDLSRNLIESFRDIKAIVRALNSLKALKLNGNRFRILDSEYPNDWLVINKRVKELDMDNIYQPMTMIESLIERSYLTSLSLASNKLCSPIDGPLLPSLRHLNLASNEYQALTGLAGVPLSFPSLESLSLRSNPLDNLFHPKTFANVVSLDLSSTLLPNFDALLPIPSVFPKLESLLTTHTPLHRLPASNLQTIARIRTLASLNRSKITSQERNNAELYYLSSIASELSSAPEASESRVLRHHQRYRELCEIHGAPAINRELQGSDEPKPGTLAARLTKFTFYTPCSNQGMPSTSTSNNGLGSSISEIKREIPRTIGIYTLKGIVGRMFNLRPMSLKLVWETGEWDPVPGLADDDSWSASDDESTDDGAPSSDYANRESIEEKPIDKSKWAQREIELTDGTRNVGYWIEGREARVRVELRR